MPKLVSALCALGFLYALGPDTLNAVDFPKIQDTSSTQTSKERLTPGHTITGLVIESMVSPPSEDTLDPFLGVWIDPGLNLPKGKNALANTLKKYLGSPLDEPSLQKLRTEVSQYYQNLKRNPIDIQIDRQDVTDGVVHILIVEEDQDKGVNFENHIKQYPLDHKQELIRADASTPSLMAKYSLTASGCKPAECEEETYEEGSLSQQIEELNLSSKEKFALLAEKTDCLAKALGELNCRDLHINSRVQDYFLGAGTGFFLTADFLYWQADEDDLEYAVYSQDISQTSTVPLSDRLYGLNFEWNPGFRVGLGGMACDWDHWGVLIEYTYIFNKAHGSANIGALTSPITNFLESNWDPVLLGIYASAARAHWSVNYSTEVLEGYRNFFLGKNLIFKPHMGLLNANINQNYHAAYTLDPLSPILSSIPESHMHAKCNYWGMGVRGGADLFWHFTKNFGLYGELSGGLVYGRFHVTRNGDTVTPTSASSVPGPASPYTFKFNKKMWRTRATIQTALGLEWEAVFNRSRNRIAISLGYEFNEWFRQNQFVQSLHQPGRAAALITYDFTNADLAFKGGTLRATFNF